MHSHALLTAGNIINDAYIENTVFSDNHGLTDESTYCYGAAYAVTTIPLFFNNVRHEIFNW